MIKTLFKLVGYALLSVAELSFLIAIGIFIHSMVFNDCSIAIAAWTAFKAWVILFGLGLSAGCLLLLIGISMKSPRVTKSPW